MEKPTIPNRRKQASVREGVGLRFFVAVSAACWLASLVQAWWLAHTRSGLILLGSLFRSIPLTPDILVFKRRMPFFHSTAFFDGSLGPVFPYPAASSVLYEAFFRMAPHEIRWFYIASACAIVLLCAVLFVALRRKGLPRLRAMLLVVTAALLSYPLWYELDRKNIEIFVCVLVALSVGAWWRGRWTLGSIALGLAIALKIYPAILLALLLSERRYRQIAVTTVTALAAHVAALWLLGRDMFVASAGLADGLRIFRLAHAIGRVALGTDHSLFALAKSVWIPSMAVQAHAYSEALNVYSPVCAVACLLLYWFVLRKAPRLNQLTVLLALMVVAPPVSYDYTLLNLYPAWALLALADVQRRQQGMPAAFALLAVLLSPLDFVRWGTVELAGIARCLCLLALVCVAVRFSWQTLPGLALPEPKGAVEAAEA